jgi:hypothetical protein
VSRLTFAKLALSVALPLSLSTAACKAKTKPAAKSAPTNVAPGSGASATLNAPTAPVAIAPPDLSAATGPSTDLEAALAAWNKGSPDTVGLAVKGLVDWSKARGAMPALPPRPIDAQPARYALFKMARTLIETRSEDPALVEATLYLAQRMRREAATMMEATFGGQLADAVISLNKVPPAFAAKYAPTDDEVLQAFAAEASQVARVNAWQKTDDGQKTMAAAKAEAAKAGSNAGGPTLPTDADQLAAIGFFAAITKNMPTDKAGFLVHLKSQCDIASKSSSKLLVDVSRILPQHAERMFGYVTGYQTWLRGELGAAPATVPTAPPTPSEPGVEHGATSPH